MLDVGSEEGVIGKGNIAGRDGQKQFPSPREFYPSQEKTSHFFHLIQRKNVHVIQREDYWRKRRLNYTQLQPSQFLSDPRVFRSAKRLRSQCPVNVVKQDHGPGKDVCMNGRLVRFGHLGTKRGVGG
jgi:hypothetical protein